MLENTLVSTRRGKQKTVTRVHGDTYERERWVWLFIYPVVPKGQTKKFYKPWTGPYKVLNSLSDSTYWIKYTHHPFKSKAVRFD